MTPRISEDSPRKISPLDQDTLQLLRVQEGSPSSSFSKLHGIRVYIEISTYIQYL
jgi:hypothetical protein